MKENLRLHSSVCRIRDSLVAERAQESCSRDAVRLRVRRAQRMVRGEEERGRGGDEVSEGLHRTVTTFPNVLRGPQNCGEAR